MAFGKDSKEKCIICGNAIDITEMVVLEGRKIICAACAKQVAGAMGYAKIQPKTDAERAYIRRDKSKDNTIQKEDVERLRPKMIKAQLDRFVVGQDEAKKILAVAAYNHYKRHAMGDVSIQKSNVLLIGPTGAGKTYLMKTLAKVVDVPLAIVSSTNLTEAGYVGDDVTSILESLYFAAEGDIERAQRGIVFIDEIDKLAVASSESKSLVGGKGVQQALLPIIEGSKVVVPIGRGEHASKVEFDTTNVLFVCGGAFPDIVGIIKKRLAKSDKPTIGFGAVLEENSEEEDKDILLKVINDDLREFGLIPEFLGRLPILATLHELSVDTLKEILYKPEDSIISQFQALFEYDGVSLFFDEGALTVIAEKAQKAGTGARSLRKEMESLLTELQFEIPGSDYKEVTITKEFAEGKAVPKLS